MPPRQDEGSYNKGISDVFCQITKNYQANKLEFLNLCRSLRYNIGTSRSYKLFPTE